MIRPLLRGVVALCACTAAPAQINEFVGTPSNPTHTLDFDAPFVASGAINSNDAVFTSNGIQSASQFGDWITGSDTITSGSNGSGQSLVVAGGGASPGSAGTLTVAGIGEPLDNTVSGAGFEISLLSPASEFGALFVDQINFSYTVELFAGPVSLGLGSFAYSGSFPQPARYWSGPAAFDRVKITFLAAAGVGIDNFMIVSASTSTPTTYCTAGTSTSGCSPSITSPTQPSASFASSCVLTASGVEGQRSGMIFYGVDNTGFSPLPWSSTSTSFFCVKSPVQRSLPQASGGTLGQCDGQLSLDWNAFHVAFPGALGTPFTAGAKVYAQAWYRDPPAPRTTNLSDAIELTMLP